MCWNCAISGYVRHLLLENDGCAGRGRIVSRGRHNERKKLFESGIFCDGSHFRGVAVLDLVTGLCSEIFC